MRPARFAIGVDVRDDEAVGAAERAGRAGVAGAEGDDENRYDAMLLVDDARLLARSTIGMTSDSAHTHTPPDCTGVARADQNPASEKMAGMQKEKRPKKRGERVAAVPNGSAGAHVGRRPGAVATIGVRPGREPELELYLERVVGGRGGDVRAGRGLDRAVVSRTTAAPAIAIILEHLGRRGRVNGGAGGVGDRAGAGRAQY